MYVKLFDSILDSSIWDEDPTTRIVFITMLVMADPEGFVHAVESGVRKRANVTAQACRDALAVLEAPDIESRDQEYGGRRIERLEGGWLMLNYRRYRELRTERQRADAARQKRFRDRNRGVTGVTRNDVATNTSDSDSESLFENDALQRDPFERAWELYPKRAGSADKVGARIAWAARTRDPKAKHGATADDLIAGVERYAAYIRATGKEGTEFVKQAATFFGPREHWKETFAIPTQPTNARQATQQRSDDALRRAAARMGGQAHA